MRPIPGQPGLFRLDDFSVPPPASGYTWDVPRGRPWTIGSLGDLALLQAQWRANEARYNELKAAARPLIAARPFSASSYADMAHRIAGAPRTSIVRLSLDQFAVITRGVLSTTSQSQAIASALLQAGREGQARKILFAVKDALDSYDRMLRGVLELSRAPETLRRAVGLGDPTGGVLTTGGIIAIVIGVTFVIAVGAVLLYTLFSSLQAAEAARVEAQEFCEREAALGRPCGGPEWQAALQRAREGQRTFGNMPDLRELFSSASSLVFWGGLLAVGGLIAYAAWTAEPARRAVQARFSGAPCAPCQRATKRR